MQKKKSQHTRVHYGARKMAQQLKELIGLLQDMGLIPRTHKGIKPSVTPVSGNPMPSSDLGGHQTQDTQAYI